MITEEKTSQKQEEINAHAKDLHISLLREGRSIYVEAWGGSMYPIIKNGDTVKIEPIKNKGISIGDIVAVDIKKPRGPWFLVHRVVKVAEENGQKRYFIKGDAHKMGLDISVTLEFIAGRVTQIQRKTIKINLESSMWRYFNSVIAVMSLRYPKILIFFSGCINLLIEHRLFLSKVKNRFKEGDPLLYNTEELLLVCASKDIDELLRKEAVRLIKEGLKWESFCELAQRSGMVFLVYSNIKMLSAYVSIPQFVFERLKISHLYAVSKTISLHKELLFILEMFSRQNIPVIPLKGTLLSKRLYGDIFSRGLSIDFDLLIEEKNKDRAYILLKENGYNIFYKEIEKWQWQYDLFKPNRAMVDLHWDITMMYRSNERIKELWQAKSLAKDNGVNYYEFKEDELLLYLCAHLVNSNGLRQLRCICDIREFLHKYKDLIDWHKIIDNAYKWRLSASLYLCLKSSKELFNSDVPFWVSQKLKPNFLKLILIKIFVNRNTILRNNYLRRRFIDNFLCYIFFEIIEARSVKECFFISERILFPPAGARTEKSHIARIFKGIAKLLNTSLSIKKY